MGESTVVCAAEAVAASCQDSLWADLGSNYTLTPPLLKDNDILVVYQQMWLLDILDLVGAPTVVVIGIEIPLTHQH